MDEEYDVVDDNANDEGVEDQEFDNLDDATDALEDDEALDEVEDEEAEDEEADEVEEAEEEEAETEEEGETLVTLPDGEQVPMSELTNGYMRQRDYTHKTTEVAEERKALDEVRNTFQQRLQFAETTLSNLDVFLESLVPEEPSLALAETNPAEYQRQRAWREAAQRELDVLKQGKQQFEAAQEQFRAEDFERFKQAENAKLLKDFPELANPQKRAAFDADIAKFASEMGFPEEEVKNTVDSRILKALHWANYGWKVAQNRKNAKRRVEAPKKAKAKPARSVPEARSNRQAKQRLRKTGSLADALAIDFE